MKEDTGQVGEGRRKKIERTFWSGELGLTLVTVSLVVFIFLILPMEHAGLPARRVTDDLGSDRGGGEPGPQRRLRSLW